MNAFSMPRYYVRRQSPPGLPRMANYSCNAAPSRKPATIASTERLLAACTCRDKDPVIMRNFQYLLLVTVTDLQQSTDESGKRE